MVKIAIHGKARSGKDAAADLIEGILKFYGKPPIRTAFANPIKEIILQMFPQAEKNCLYGPSELRDRTIPDVFDNNNQPVTYRKLLLDLGKFGKLYDEDVWVKAVLAQIEKFDSAVISDLRFKNEYVALKKKNFITLKIEAPTNNYVVNDISEKDLSNFDNSKFDFVVINKKDGIEELFANVREIVEKIVARNA